MTEEDEVTDRRESTTYRNVLRSLGSIRSAVDSMLGVSLERLRVHIDEWPRRYIEQQAALYENNYRR